MLRTRVITAVVLFAAFLLALFSCRRSGGCCLSARWRRSLPGAGVVDAPRWAARLVTGRSTGRRVRRRGAARAGGGRPGSGLLEAAWRLGAGFYGLAAVFWLLVVRGCNGAGRWRTLPFPGSPACWCCSRCGWRWSSCGRRGRWRCWPSWPSSGWPTSAPTLPGDAFAVGTSWRPMSAW